ncbi:hypothetical protein WISP_12282 [Willisornis vidua]|uniref:Uncharacterized protein n=1 Tax=Willisornis vidua TaxID=1566151 RepID=A0ABQ9DRE6_9PASS|nr:hypothetical protein WISP_12282 [Willisornis vidua]
MVVCQQQPKAGEDMAQPCLVQAGTWSEPKISSSKEPPRDLSEKVANPSSNTLENPGSQHKEQSSESLEEQGRMLLTPSQGWTSLLDLQRTGQDEDITVPAQDTRRTGGLLILGGFLLLQSSLVFFGKRIKSLRTTDIWDSREEE